MKKRGKANIIFCIYRKIKVSRENVFYHGKDLLKDKVPQLFFSRKIGRRFIYPSLNNFEFQKKNVSNYWVISHLKLNFSFQPKVCDGCHHNLMQTI